VKFFIAAPLRIIPQRGEREKGRKPRGTAVPWTIWSFWKKKLEKAPVFNYIFKMKVNHIILTSARCARIFKPP